MRLITLAFLVLTAYAPPAQAQQDFKMFVQRYEGGDWGDTSLVMHFWFGQNDLPDSVWLDDRRENWLEYYYDWQPVSQHVQSAAFDRAPRLYSQFGIDRAIAGRVLRYSSRNEAPYPLYYREYAVTEDSLLRSYTSLSTVAGQPDYTRKDSFDYNTSDEVSDYEQVLTYLGNLDPQFKYNVAKQYNSQGQISLSMLTNYQYGKFASLDSVIYSYDSENLLTASVRHFRQSDGLEGVTYTDYGGWAGFEQESRPFLDPKALDIVGGRKYLQAKVTAESNRAGPYNVEFRKSYDTSNRLLREESRDSISLWRSVSEYEYYESGDLKKLFRYSTPLSDTTKVDPSFTRDEYSNAYAADGRILSSIYSHSNQLRERYTFEYNAPSFVDRRDDDQSSQTNGIVTVYNLLGVIVYGGNAKIESSMTSLPSGLYFISIDGGRPRKHLIP